MLHFYFQADKYNRVIVGGASHTVGIGGYTLGGGHSPIGKKYGLAVDNLLEVEMVTANGSIVTCNDHGTSITDASGHVHSTNNADLFWALRGGGGGTFGIVTKFTFKLHQPPKQFTAMTCFKPMLNGTINVGQQYMQDFNVLAASLPPEWGGYQMFSGYNDPQLPSAKGSISLYLNHAGEFGDITFNTILPFYNKYEDNCQFANYSTFLEMVNVTGKLYFHIIVFNTFMQPDSFIDEYYRFVFNTSLTYPNSTFYCTNTMVGGMYIFLKFDCFSYRRKKLPHHLPSIRWRNGANSV